MQTEYAEKYITLGLKIAYYRKKRGYTQEVFAEKIAGRDVSQSILFCDDFSLCAFAGARRPQQYDGTRHGLTLGSSFRRNRAV